MKKMGLLIVCLFMGMLSVNASRYETGFKVKSCIDGDTISLTRNGKDAKYRLLAVNAPEKDSEKYGKEAGLFTCDLIRNAEEIIIEYDDHAETDKYNRVLAWIWADGKLVQEELIKNGYAEVSYIYDSYKYTNSLCKVQHEAVTGKVNIWSVSGRKEDFCSNVDTSQINSNISYEKLINGDDYSEGDMTDEEAKQVQEGLQKAEAALDKINKTTDEISNYLKNNSDQVSSILVFIFLGCAAIYLLVQFVKNNKQ